MHVVALTDDNEIVSWGVNDKGALGRDTNWEEPLRDVDAESSEDDAGDLNPLESTPAAIQSDLFPPGTVFVQVAAGDSCSLALTDTGFVYGWGTFRNSDGKERFFYNSAGELVEVQPRPHLIPGLKDITQIACGADHALALDASGDIWAWGISEQGQLGRRLLPRSANLDLVPHRVEICRKNAKYIASGQYHSFAVDNRDNVWAWWLNSYGEARHIKRSGDSTSLPYPMKIPGLCGKGVVLLDGGAHHSVAVTASGECFVWGRIDGGQLGVDFTSDQLADGSLVLHDERGKPRICAQPVVLTHIGKVSHASCGTDHTIFVNKDGEAYSAGFGSMGQLGRGAEDEVPVARLIKDKALKDRVLTWTGAGGQFSLVAGP